MHLGPDGNLYYLSFPTDTSAASELHRIRYQPAGNLPPVAQMSVSPSGAATGQPFTFSGAGSYDPGNNVPLVYQWRIGDGSVITGTNRVTVTHTYAGGPPTIMTATLT